MISTTKTLVLSMILIILSQAGSAQQVFEEWASLKGTQDFYLKGKSITDASANVYQCGATLNSNGDYDAIVTKYDRRGIEQWTEQINAGTGGDQTFVDIALNGQGRLTATGVSRNPDGTSSDLLTAQISTSGGIIWIDYYNHSGSIFNVASAAAYEANGETYITGATFNLSNQSDVLILKYNASGNVLWSNSSDYSGGGHDAAIKIQPGGSKVTITGGSQIGSSSWAYLAQTYSTSTGALLNTFTSVTNGTSIDRLKDMALDNAGNIYVTGTTEHPSQGTNMYTMKLDDNLNVLWEAAYNYSGSSSDKAFGLALDNSNNVIITGASELAQGNTQFTTIKYNSNGLTQWIQHLDAGDGLDSAKAITTDASGNVYISGTFSNGSNQDIKTVKYNPGGGLVWEIDFNGVFNGEENLLDITHDGENAIITAQTQSAAGTYKYAALKYKEQNVVIPPDEEIAPSSMYFTQNAGILRTTAGGAANEVKFIDEGSYPKVYVGDNKLSYVFAHTDSTAMDTVHRIDMIFNKRNPTMKTYPMEKMDFYQNYYLPTVTSGRRERVASYQKLVSLDAWEDVDLMISHNNKGIKYYLICKPGFDIADIGWEYAGASSVTIGGSGELILASSIGDLIMPQGEAYEVTTSGTRINKSWQPGYTQAGGEVGLSIGSYSSSNTLVLELDRGLLGAGLIDDYGNLGWSTYYGNFGVTSLSDVKISNDDDIYITGLVDEDSYPISTGETILSDYAGGRDAVIFKLNSNHIPIWVSFFGGDNDDFSRTIAL